MEYLLNGKKCVPVSDIDGLIDCHGKGWILFECKYGDCLPPTGQRMLIEKFVDDMQEAGVPAVAMICSHGEEERVLLKDCAVTAIYTEKRWRYYKRDYSKAYTVKELTDAFLKRYAPEMIGA